MAAQPNSFMMLVMTRMVRKYLGLTNRAGIFSPMASSPSGTAPPGPMKSTMMPPYTTQERKWGK